MNRRSFIRELFILPVVATLASWVATKPTGSVFIMESGKSVWVRNVRFVTSQNYTQFTSRVMTKMVRI